MNNYTFFFCSFGKDEIGVKSSVLLNFLAQALPYNKYLIKYICQDKPLIVEEKETLKQFPYQAIKEQNVSSHNFLSIILNVIQTAGEIVSKKFYRFLTIFKIFVLEKNHFYVKVFDLHYKFIGQHSQVQIFRLCVS